MDKDELAIAWEPVPRSANHYMALTVNHLEQLTAAVGFPVVLIVSSPMKQSDGETREIAWRITFHMTHGYRCRHVGPSPESQQVTWPQATDGARVACWEIVHSQWLPMALAGFWSDMSTAHHYAIVDYYNLYEIAANWYEVEELGEGEKVLEDLHLDIPRL
jgi:hypothetical protein